MRIIIFSFRWFYKALGALEQTKCTTDQIIKKKSFFFLFYFLQDICDQFELSKNGMG